MTTALRGDFSKIIGHNKNLGEIAYAELRSFPVANMMLNAGSESASSMD
jgi:hypothetical protein